MKKRSAGTLLFRRRASGIEVFLVHPGGPFWVKKDLGSWSIPKGEYKDDEEPLSAARREFAEETGSSVDGTFVELGELRQPSGKVVRAWALEGDIDADSVKSNSFTMEWPPGSGKMQEYPEVDAGAWFPIAIAKQKILKGQAGFIERLLDGLSLRS